MVTAIILTEGYAGVGDLTWCTNSLSAIYELGDLLIMVTAGS